MTVLHPDLDPKAGPFGPEHYLCPDGPTQAGEPVACHHLVPRGPSHARSMTCTYCGKTQSELKEVLT